MPEQRITIEIDENGKITAKTDGFEGSACLDMLQELLEDEPLPASIKPTDDYYKTLATKTTGKLTMERK